MVVVQTQVTHRMIMIFGNNSKDIVLRKATAEDLDTLKHLVDRHKNELGFVIRSALERSIQLSEIIVAINTDDILAGFTQYHHRKDGQTTLYNIVVDKNYQRQGIGKRMIDKLKAEAKERQQHFILLKCPEELPSNEFYRNYGFTLSEIEKGKKKPLSIWRIDV